MKGVKFPTMNTLSQHMAKLLFSVLLLCSCSVVKCGFNDRLVSKICSQRTYSSEIDPYNGELWIVLDDLVLYTSDNGCNYYAQHGSCYSHGTCSAGLAKSDCGDCLDLAKNTLYAECGLGRGAQVQIQDCRMRYEDYPFIE